MCRSRAQKLDMKVVLYDEECILQGRHGMVVVNPKFQPGT